jgi:hypothetical protein
LAKSGPSPNENVSKSCQRWGERLMLVFGGVNAIELDRPRHVRVTPVSDRTADIVSGPFRANGGHAGADLDQAINERTEPRNALPML